jgi:hypothetical protein
MLSQVKVSTAQAASLVGRALFLVNFPGHHHENSYQSSNADTGGLLAGPRHGLRSDGSLAKPMKQAGNRKKQ